MSYRCHRGPTLALLVTLATAGASAPAPGWSQASPASGDPVTTPIGVPAHMPEPEPGEFELYPPEREPHYWRALLENIGLQTIGTIWYFSQQNFNSQDWDFGPAGHDIENKFLTTEQIRFDNNSFLFNQVYHPASYLFSYQFARANNIRPSIAFLYAFGSSLFWEYLGELREKVSVNDLIVSPLAGMAWGEVAYNYGEYFNSPEIEGRLAHQILTGIWGIPRLFHDWLDDVEPAPLRPGAPRLFHPYFRALSGLQLRRGLEGGGADHVRPLALVGLDTELVVLYGYHAPGRFSRWFREGNFSDFHLEVSFDDEIREIALGAEAVVWGYYTQDLRPTPGGERSGWALMIGAGRAYDIVYRDSVYLKDRLGLMHVLGPSLQIDAWEANGLHLQASLDAFFDFAAVRSLAYDDYRLVHGDQGIRTDLQKQIYYFGIGPYVSPSLKLEFAGFGVGAQLRWGQYWSVQGLDRFEEQLTKTVHLNDRLVDASVFAHGPAVLGGLRVHVELEQINRRSQIDDFVDRASFQQLELRLDYAF